MTPISFIALMLLANFLATSAERPGERSWVGEHFYGDDGTTGYHLNEQGLCVKKGGKQKGQEIYEEVKVDVNADDPICLSDIHEWSKMPECGTDNYDAFAYCAKANFFGKEGVHGFIKKKELLPRNGKSYTGPETLRELEQFFWQDMMLVLVEGCIKCTQKYHRDAKLTFYQSFREGLIPSQCKNEAIELGETEVEGEGAFKYALLPHERLCPSRKKVDDDVELEPLNGLKNITLTIQHQCTDDGKKATAHLEFPPLNVDYHLDEHGEVVREIAVNHVLQIRQIELDLEKFKDGKRFILDLKEEKSMKEGFAGKFVVPEIKPLK